MKKAIITILVTLIGSFLISKQSFALVRVGFSYMIPNSYAVVFVDGHHSPVIEKSNITGFGFNLTLENGLMIRMQKISAEVEYSDLNRPNYEYTADVTYYAIGYRHNFADSLWHFAFAVGDGNYEYSNKNKQTGETIGRKFNDGYAYIQSGYQITPAGDIFFGMGRGNISVGYNHLF